MNSASEKTIRVRIAISGIVQGVGFRPFVCRLAEQKQLGGAVLNDSKGLTVELEGAPEDVKSVIETIKSKPPPLATIEGLSVSEVEPKNREDFIIDESIAAGEKNVFVSPDIAVCEDCLADLYDSGNRRYRYPFINCTNCGPRYSIIKDMPYDRVVTSMAGFKMCAQCRAEYEDIASRWRHAQPIACPSCGPKVQLCDANGKPVESADPIAATVRLLENGHIVAVKGIGGFHLACDASNGDSVAELRRRKKRPHKPFAIMVRDVNAARKLAAVGRIESELLRDKSRPIVLLKSNGSGILPSEVSGAIDLIGVMLPYTPMHYLLMEGDYPALVMTSGNRSDEPIISDNDAAFLELDTVADFFLVHDRPILHRVDDSVAGVFSKAPVLLRRSRGYTPSAIRLPSGGPSVFAVGANLKNTFCLTKNDRALIGPHIGDLSSPDAVDFFQDSAVHMQKLFGVEPRLIVHDMHPDYYSTRLAEEWTGCERLALQHHHAHALSCLAENGYEGPALAICLDGAGYGIDGQAWGGEILKVEGLDSERLAHFRYLPLPGGEASVREPWRMAMAALVDALGVNEAKNMKGMPPFGAANSQITQAVLQLAAAAGSNVQTSGCGRLFDAVASLLGVRQRVTFEGQAALELECAAGHSETDVRFDYEISTRKTPFEIDFRPLIRDLAAGISSGTKLPILARAFHNTVVAVLIETVALLSGKTALKTVALSGGAMQNKILFEGLRAGLAEKGFSVLLHRKVPPNDGGISLGQAWAGILFNLRRS